MKFSMTGQEKCDLLIQVIAFEGLTVSGMSQNHRTYVSIAFASPTDSGSRVFVVSGKVSANNPATNPTAPKMISGKAIPTFVGITDPLIKKKIEKLFKVNRTWKFMFTLYILGAAVVVIV